MGAGYHGGFGNTTGANKTEIEDKAETIKKPKEKAKPSTPLFSNTGHVSKRSVSANREEFYGKTVSQLDRALR